MSALLKLDGVTKFFGGLAAVKDLSFEVGSGEIIGLIGPNGAGKTTIFNLVTGVYKPNSGKIVFDGMDISGKKTHTIARLGISRTFQTVRPLPRMTVLENVMMGGLFGREHRMSMRHARESAVDILSYAGLSEKVNFLAGDLTLAEQRRLELARWKNLVLVEVLLLRHDINVVKLEGGRVSKVALEQFG